MKILLLIDIQYGFKAAEELISYIEKINIEKYDKIIATQFINNEKTLFYKNNYKEMMKEDENINLYPIINKISDNIIKKDTYSIPLNKLYQIVNKKDIENIDIIGVDTDACVLATMFSLWDEKIPFTLLKARTSGKYGIHDAAKLIMRRNLFLDLPDKTNIFHKIKEKIN